MCYDYLRCSAVAMNDQDLIISSSQAVAESFQSLMHRISIG
jgi:hypothetical protein